MAKIGDVEGILRLRDEFTGVLTRAQSQLQAAGQKMMAIGAGMSQVGGTLTRNVTLPLAAIGAVAIKTFADFDAAMIQSQAIMGDLSDTMKTDMEQTARDVAKATTFSAKEAAESYFFLASAGLDAATSIKALPLVAQFAQAGMFDMATATDLLTDAQSALGLTVRDAATGIVDVTATMANMARVGDVLVKANTLANATVEQFSQSLTREAGAAMKSFNIDIEEGVAVLAAFADQGVKGEIAGTGLSRILRLMTSAAVKNEKAYKDLNVEVFDAEGNINALSDIIGDLENAFDGMSDKTRTQSLELLGFRARVQGVILPLIGTSKSIARFNKELRDSSGIMKEVATKQLEAFSAKMGLLKDKFIDVAIALGAQITSALEKLIPFLEKAAVFLGKAVAVFGKLPAPVKLAALALVGLVAALGPLLIIGGSMLTLFANLAIIGGSGLGFAAVASAAAPITGVFGSILGVLGGAGGLMGVLGGVVTFLTGPVGIAVAIGVALVAFKPFRDVVVNIGSLLFTLARGALKVVIGGFKMVAALLSPVMDFFVGIASAIGGVLGPALTSAATWIGELNEGLNELITNEAALAFEAAESSAAGFAISTEGLADAMRQLGTEALPGAIDNMIAAGVSTQDLKAGLGILSEAGKVTAEEFDALRTALLEAEGAAGTGTDASEAFAAALAEMEGQADKSTTSITKLDQAMQDMGFVTAKQATSELTSLGAALAGGQVPAIQMKEKIDELAEKYEKLGLLDIPQVREALDALNREYEVTNGVFDTAISKAARLGRMMENLPPFIDDVGTSAEQTRKNLDDMVSGMDISKIEPPFRSAADVMKDFGITTIDVGAKVSDLTRLVASGRGPAVQTAQAIAKFRDELKQTGQLTPEVAKELQRLTNAALENATAAEMSALGFKGFFNELTTGIPAIDTFLGKFGGIFDAITGVLGGLGGKVGGFFSSLTDQIGGLFGQGGQKGGDNFFAGIAGALGGLGGLFGSKAKESTDSFVSTVSAGVGAVTPLFTTAATEAGGGFASGIQQTLGGGGGFDIGAMFNTTGQLATKGFTLGLSEVPGQAGSIFAQAADQGGGGFLSGLTGMLGGGGKGGGISGIFKSIFGGGGGGGDGEGGGFLSGLFSGAGGGAGGNFLGGLMSGMSSGMGAAESAIQGIFQAGLSLIPIVGPILSKFAGPLFKGIKAIGSKIKGFFGVSASEKQAREIGSSLDDVFRGLLDTGQLAEATAAAAGTANDQWAVSNIAVRDAYLAIGKSNEEAAAATTRLSESVRKSPEEAQAAVDAIKAVTEQVQAAMELTGLSLIDLRNKAINDAKLMGISVEEAFTRLATAVPEAVEGAATKQCESQTKAATCGVNSATQVTTAVEESAAAQTVAVADAAAQQIETVATVVEANVKAQTDITLAASTAAVETTISWSDAAARLKTDYTSALEAVRSDTALTAEESKQAVQDMTRQYEVSLQALNAKSNEAFTEMSDTAKVKIGEIGETIDTGMRAVEDSLARVADIGDRSFRQISESAGRAAAQALSAFHGMEDEMVLNSIFPDTASLASADLRSIGVAAESAAAQAEGAFQAADLSLTPGTTPGGAIRSDTLSPVMKTGGSPALANLEGRGGRGEPLVINLVVDGQVLAKTTIKNMPRALANAGVANRTR